MKIRRGMSQPDSEETSGTFHDVVASFSVEEWKLLHKWQKELYKNVMKDIHNVLSSLGPLIATSIFSIGSKEKEDLSILDHQDSKTRHGTDHNTSDTVASYDVSFGLNKQEHLLFKDHQETERRENSDCHDIGYPILSFDNILRAEQEFETSLMEQQSSEEGRSHAGPCSVSVTIKEECDNFCMGNQESELEEIENSSTEFPFLQVKSVDGVDEHYSAEVEECNIGLNAGLTALKPVAPFLIKKEQEMYFIDNLFPEGISGPTCDGNRGRKGRHGSDLQYGERTDQCTMSSVEVTAPQCTVMELQSWSQLQSDFSQELKEEQTTQCESFLRNKLHLDLHGVSNIALTDAYKENESNMRDPPLLTCQKNSTKNWSLCQFPEGEKSFRQNLGLSKPFQTFKEERPYQCTMCRKRFIRKSYLITHMRTHTGERPFQCTQCEKCFSLKKYLVRHRRTHSGERPYQCFECDKSFNLNALLITHQRIHTGERPYQCTECLKSFCQKGHLSRHRKKHTGERPYKCTECEKSFFRKEHFTRHQKIHTGDTLRSNPNFE
ncbi:uncharacterized protein LOC144763252 [Lissotriton helveticus]